ncbi:MAG: glycosyltransferase family 87 protein, partial [Bacteroidota bacterium]
YFIVRSAALPIGDFGNYYYASKFLLHGRWGTWIYDPASFNLAIYSEGQRNFFLNYTPVPPLSALLYLPFAAFDAAVSKILSNSVNAVLLLFSLHRLQAYFKVNLWLMLLVPVLFFTPIRNIVYEGQSYFLLLFLLSEGLIRYLEQEKWVAMLLWALSIHLKVSPAFVVLFLLFEKDWKALLKLATVTVLCLLASLPFLGTSTWTNYSINILPRLFNGEINNTYSVNYQSMQVLLKTLFVPDLMHNPAAWFNNPVTYHRLSGAFNILIYGIAALCAFTKVKPEIKYCTWLMCAMLVSGYGNSFGLLLLVIPLFCLHTYFTASKGLFITIAVALFLIANLPLSWSASLPVPLQFPRLYLLIALFFTCVFFIKPVLKPYYFLTLFFAFIIPADLKKYTQNYFLPREENILTYNFNLQDDSLAILYFDDLGPQQKKMALPFHTKKVTDLKPAGKVFPHEYIPVSKLVNDSIIIYLSDRNRGIGFYTLRYELLK